MKPMIKLGSLILAIVMACSAFVTSGCSLNKEWSYKTSSEELPIGVYIYALYSSYNQALGFAKELDDYDSTKDTWLDMEITDDDDKKQIAREWIKEKAELLCLNILAVDEQLVKEGASVDEAELASAREQAETYWNVGPYASYNYAAPLSETYEPFGISLDSFKLVYADFQVKYSALFDAVYGEGGSMEPKDSEFKEFFLDNYVKYSYMQVNLYNSTTDDAGQKKNVALSDDEVKKLTKEFDSYAEKINSGKASYDDVVKDYMKANNLKESPSTVSTEHVDDISFGEGELTDAIKKLDTDKATTVKVGSGDSAIYYIVYKGDIKENADEYIDSNKSSILAKMKQDEFEDYVEGLSKKLKHEKNTAVIDSYDPKMFFVAEEPTTSTGGASKDESSES